MGLRILDLEIGETEQKKGMVFAMPQKNQLSVLGVSESVRFPSL